MSATTAQMGCCAACSRPAPQRAMYECLRCRKRTCGACWPRHRCAGRRFAGFKQEPRPERVPADDELGVQLEDVFATEREEKS